MPSATRCLPLSSHGIATLILRGLKKAHPLRAPPLPPPATRPCHAQVAETTTATILFEGDAGCGKSELTKRSVEYLIQVRGSGSTSLAESPDTPGSSSSSLAEALFVAELFGHAKVRALVVL